ncbi:hypothetical protein ABTQ33_07245 [Paucilactobacillus suebicus]|uniref:Uncharacterized protein n=1 Tax=Paucilactobacillus suebicus DSM 5007 = KCTC 3549 TaxID=1423807 RepID=A0A0R1WAG6_9LACO|nr:hypothetical protein [Paucilactobacillus suebicus]KRM12070.1 hypothetical protein FD16_GL000282 [Paucilactobacillus suebicus DSM 5007 = KCTC 3549]
MKKPTKKMSGSQRRAENRNNTTDSGETRTKNIHNHAPAHRAKQHLIHSEAKRKSEVQ